MGITRWSMPSSTASFSASVSEWSEEYRDGMSTPWTWSGPTASAAMTATSDESTPPDSAIATSVNPFLRT